ncbi:glycogen debranching protein [Sediminibacterium sp. C3]|uniref:alpha-L-rhamnosidase-related protein n=1 Tax=Sediminibacterium sp. C3 TaxID=1267211 RepID=UPI0008FEF477|nr:glycogen debranching protein [Sediminibacterium sp. C3]
MPVLKSILLISAFCLSYLFPIAQGPADQSVSPLFKNHFSLAGKPAFLETPYNTTGDKLYMVGHQDGSFPDLGWHVKGEMGGIWHHPIKLMDGFNARLFMGQKSVLLNKADSFINYPFGNKHVFNINDSELIVERFQFVPDQLGALYVEYKITNKGKHKRQLNFEFEAISNLMPVWLGERTGMVNSQDHALFDKHSQRWIVKDSLNPWWLVFGSAANISAVPVKRQVTEKVNTTVNVTNYELTIAPNQSVSLPFVIAGSAQSKERATAAYETLQQSAYALLEKKIKRLKEMNSVAKLQLNDASLTRSFEWLKYNSDWLIADVDGMGRGIVAGLPDYPWWFGGDMAYTLKALIAMGQKELVYSSIDLIQRISEKHNGNGRIVHEVSTNGAVFNPGNVNETPQFISLLWEVFCWTGDKAFLEKYFPAVVKGLNWVLNENDADHNLLPDGAGMMEIHGLTSEMIDVATYTQKAFADAAQMALLLKKPSLAKDYQQKADLIQQTINTKFWVEKNQSYADFIATKTQALQLMTDAIVRADTLGNTWAVNALKEMQGQTRKDTSNQPKGFVMHHNWVVNTPLETGIAPRENAIKALNTAKKFSNSFGMYVTGIDKNVKRDEKEYSYAAAVGKNDFTYTGTVMTLPTAVQIIAENNYGRPNEAYALLKKVDKTFGYALPGSMYEVSPDYGMMTQAWNVYAYGVPIVKQFFGLHPKAFNKEIMITPVLPDSLTHGSLTNIPVGDNRISVSFSKVQNKLTYKINCQQSGWRIIFRLPSNHFSICMVNNKSVQPQWKDGFWQLIIREPNAEIALSY